MKKAISVASLYLVVYIIILSLTGMSDITFVLFTLSPFPIIYMVYKVLKDNFVELKTFESHFYADREDLERVRIKN